MKGRALILAIIAASLCNLGFAQNGKISFRENKGQVSDQFYKPRPDVLFSGTDGQLTFHLKHNSISYQFSRVDSWKKRDSLSFIPRRTSGEQFPAQLTIQRLDVEWINSNRACDILKCKPADGYENFYSETCPNGALEVKSYRELIYKNLYKGIDVKWYEDRGHLKYDYIVAPGADYGDIQLDIKGADKIIINQKGELVIKTPLGEMVEQAPIVKQGSKFLKAKWNINGTIVSFHIKGVDPTRELIIDPLVRLWGTYYGGPAKDDGWYSVCDASGNVYLTGDTQSSLNIATAGAFQAVFGGNLEDAFITKFSPAGARLWATYYGGAGFEIGQLCIIGPGNDLYLLGNTTTTNSMVIATPGTYQQFFAGGNTMGGDGFLVRFNSSGARVWGTYFGGSGNEWNFALCKDNGGNVYVGGGTNSTAGIVTTGAYQVVYGGGIDDAFIMKFNASGNLLWSTYLGGNSYDHAWGCAFDGSGVYVSGSTTSGSGIATPGSHQVTYGGGGSNGDGFLARFDVNGNLTWSTYYGGPGDDVMYNAVVDNAGYIYVSGEAGPSSGTVIATTGSHQFTYGGGVHDCMLIKFNSNGVRQWGTYYGGGGNDEWAYCCKNQQDEIFIAGETTTQSGPAIATPCTYQDVNGGGSDAFLAKFSAGGVRQWGTFYGGIGIDSWPTCTTDNSGNIYLNGRTTTNTGTVMVTPGAHQVNYGGGQWDGFIAKFSDCISVAPNTTSPADLEKCYGDSTSLTTSVNCFVNWYSTPGGPVIATGSVINTSTLSNNTTYYVQDLSCGPSSSLTAITVTVHPLPDVQSFSSDTLLCSGSVFTLSATGASSYTWSPGGFNNPSFSVSAASSITYTVSGFDGNCSNSNTILISVVLLPTLSLNYNHNPVCYGSTVSASAVGAQSYTWSATVPLSTFNSSLVTTDSLLTNSSFTVVAENFSGPVSCAAQSSFAINVIPPIAPSISPSVEICYGSKVPLLAGGGNTYYWSGENIDDPLAAGVVVSPQTTGIYSVDVSYNNICPVTASVLVKVNPSPRVFAGNDTAINVGDPVFISASGDGTLLWISGENIVCKECAVTNVNPFTKTCYVVEATDAKGCKAQDDVCIDIIKDYSIYVPNTFTPNGDGLNDVFNVYGFGIKELELRIYDRWGVKLFSTKDLQQGWNGYYKGSLCEQATYIYQVSYVPFKGKSDVLVGHVNLLRGSK